MDYSLFMKQATSQLNGLTSQFDLTLNNADEAFLTCVNNADVACLQRTMKTASKNALKNGSYMTDKRISAIKGNKISETTQQAVMIVSMLGKVWPVSFMALGPIREMENSVTKIGDLAMISNIIKDEIISREL